jgi:hypothetical protein
MKKHKAIMGIVFPVQENVQEKMVGFREGGSQ